jgi:hypothetical protein
MPTTVNVIDLLSGPELAALQQVLDTGGPYGPGDYTLSDFTTNGAFLLPAGTYSVSGTYGLIVQATGVFPPQAGFKIGWNDVTIVASGDRYEDRIAQIVFLRTLPITGAKVIQQIADVTLLSQAFFLDLLVGPALTIGLHVEPNWHVDLYYFCVL